MYLFEMSKTIGKHNDALVLEMGNKSPKDLFSFLIPQFE
jgi:hypothetical protein